MLPDGVGLIYNGGGCGKRNRRTAVRFHRVGALLGETRRMWRPVDVV